MVSGMGAHHEFFARVVQDRRNHFGLSMEKVRERGGPAVPTQVEAENQRLRENVRPSTFTKYDTALEWAPGSAAAAFRDGRTPVLLGREPRTYTPGSAHLSLGLKLRLPLLEAQRGLHTARPAELPDALERLDAAVTALIGPFVTDLLERNRSDEHPAPHPLIEIAFGEILSAPVDPADPNAEERLYRRWLTGRTENIDPAMAQQFEQRYRSSVQSP